MSKNAVSLCLFKSPKFNRKRHIDQLNRALNNPAHKSDILIFYEKGFPIGDIHKTEQVKFIECEGEEGYRKHLYRYRSCAPEFDRYESIFFIGADTANGIGNIPIKRVASWAKSAFAINGTQMVTLLQVQQRVGGAARPIPCMISGSCVMRRAARRSFWNFLAKNRKLHQKNPPWSVDEILLSKWWEGSNISTMMLLPGRLRGRAGEMFIEHLKKKVDKLILLRLQRRKLGGPVR